jgi:hypothetical protein
MPKRLEYLHKSCILLPAIFFSGSIDKTYGIKQMQPNGRYIPHLSGLILFKEDFNT